MWEQIKTTCILSLPCYVQQNDKKRKRSQKDKSKQVDQSPIFFIQKLIINDKRNTNPKGKE